MTPPLTAPFVTLASFQDLCDYLREEAVACTHDAAAQVSELPTSSGMPLYLRWELSLPLVQIVHLAVTEVPAERLAATEHALARLNHAAPLGGFALDRERRFVYLRLTLLRDQQGRVAVAELDRALRAVVSTVADYLPLLVTATAPAEATAATAPAAVVEREDPPAAT